MNGGRIDLFAVIILYPIVGVIFLKYLQYNTCPIKIFQIQKMCEVK